MFCAKSDFETIVVDSLSVVTQEVLDVFRGKLIMESTTGKIDARQAYGKVAESMGREIRKLRDLEGKNVIFIAKEKKVLDDKGDIIEYEAYMPGQVLPFDLPYLVDEVFNIQFDRKGVRKIQTASDFKRVCKDRSGCLANPEVPNFTVIFDKIKAGVRV